MENKDTKNTSGKFALSEVFLEITNRCNFNCSFCPYQKITRRKEDMPKEKAFALIDEIDHSFSFQWISFHLYGEPSLHPDLIPILAHATQKGMNVNFTSNGLRLSPGLLEELLGIGVWRIILSIQAPKGKFYSRGTEAISEEAYFNHIETIVRKFKELKPSFPESKLELHYLDSRAFRPGLALVEEKSQVKEIVHQYVKAIENKASMNENKSLDQYKVEDSGTNESGILYQISDGIFIRFKPAISFGNAIVDEEKTKSVGYKKLCFAADCFFPATTLNILSNGDLVSCCMDFNGDNVLGNVFDEGGIKKVFWGDKAQNFRQQFKDKKIVSARCQECLGGVFFGAPI
jgi:radical SAM protein with 4Fe4S-binding SPASM domain